MERRTDNDSEKGAMARSTVSLIDFKASIHSQHVKSHQLGSLPAIAHTNIIHFESAFIPYAPRAPIAMDGKSIFAINLSISGHSCFSIDVVLYHGSLVCISNRNLRSWTYVYPKQSESTGANTHTTNETDSLWLRSLLSTLLH